MGTFRSPNFIFGPDALDQLELIKGEKCLIVTDKNLVKIGISKLITDKLDEFEKGWQIFDEVVPDPLEKIVFSAKQKCMEYEPDLIIGLGGGSSMDIAKAAWFLYENPEMDVDDINPFTEIQMGVKAKCIAIPTTAGTGSEATWASIITRIDENGHPMKLETTHLDMVPSFAIIDPILTQKLPVKLTVATAFDAYAQGFEGLISEWRNDFADACCLHTIEIVKEFLPKITADPENLFYREKLANAASLSGLGFGNSQVVLGHAMGHSLGAVFHITHGLAVGVMLPYILEYAINDPDSSDAKEILAQTAKKVGVAEWRDDPDLACKKLIQAIRKLQKDVNFPTNLQLMGITREKLEENLPRLIQLVNESPSVTMNPREIMNDGIEKMLLYAFEEKPVDF